MAESVEPNDDFELEKEDEDSEEALSTEKLVCLY